MIPAAAQQLSLEDQLIKNATNLENANVRLWIISAVDSVRLPQDFV